MNRWKPWTLLVVMTLLLAGCGTAPQPAALPSTDEEQDPTAVEVDQEEIAAIDASWDAYEVEFLGTGMGSQWDGELDSAVLAFDPSRVEQVIARATVRFIDDPDFPDVNQYTQPDEVVFTAYDASGAVLDTEIATGVPPLDPTPDGGAEGIGAALIYQVVFADEIDSTAVAAVGVDIFEDAADDDPRFENRAFELYVLREPSDGTVSVGGTPNQFIWWKIDEEVAEYELDLPEEFEGGSVPVTFAVTDMDSDERVVILQVVTDEGTLLIERTFDDPGYHPDGDPTIGEDFLEFWADWAVDDVEEGFDTREELLLATLLAEVPAGTDSLIARVISPDPGEYAAEGDSVIFSGVTAKIRTPEEPGVEGGEGCTPGFWKNWTGLGPQPNAWPTPYDPGTLFSEVFDDAFPGMTLLDVVSQGGGGLNALGRHTVAALLNAAHSGVSYDLTESEVIALFNGVYPDGDYESLKNEFEEFNEQGCPLNRNNFSEE